MNIDTPNGPKEYRHLQFIQGRGGHKYSKRTLRDLRIFTVHAENGWAQIFQNETKGIYTHLQFIPGRDGHRYSKMDLKGFTDIYSSCTEEVGTDITKGT